MKKSLWCHLTGLWSGGPPSGPKQKRTEVIHRLTTHDTEAFIASDFFRPGEMIDGVKISVEELGEAFARIFLKKVEEKIRGEDIVIRRVLKESSWSEIQSEIMAPESRIYLCNFWSALKLPMMNEKGRSASAHITGADGELWDVIAINYADGWYFDAATPTYKKFDKLAEDHLIISRPLSCT